MLNENNNNYTNSKINVMTCLATDDTNDLITLHVINGKFFQKPVRDVPTWVDESQSTVRMVVSLHPLPHKALCR